MSHAADLKHVATWLRQLAELCRPGSEPVTKDKLATYATFLLPDFPIAAFTTASVATIARGHEFFPPLSLLHKHLTTWWEGNRPPPPNLLLTGPLADGMDDIDRRMVSSWITNRERVPEKDWRGWHAEGLFERGLHMLRAKFPRAYRYIINHDLEAAEIAVRRGWNDRSEQDARQSWQDPVAIRASVRLVLSSPLKQLELGQYLGKCVSIAAPQHMHHVPPEWHPIGETVDG